jgi:hypothetical protein
MSPADDARDKLLLLTAALFAVRLFRTPAEQLGSTAFASVSTVEKLEQWAQADREAELRGLGIIEGRGDLQAAADLFS